MDGALCALAEMLTLRPAAVRREDIRRLEALGLDHRAIFDAVHVVAYFNYVNRLAEGLGVELEDYWKQKAPEAFRAASIDEPEEEA